MQTIDVLVPDTRSRIKGKTLLEILSNSGFNLNRDVNGEFTHNVIVIPFQGRHRVPPDVYDYLKSNPSAIPVVGIELDQPENRSWPIVPMDIQLTSDVPIPIVHHTIRRIGIQHQNSLKLEKLHNQYQSRVNEISFMVDMGLVFTGTLSRRELYSLIIKKSVELIQAEFHLLFTFSQKEHIASIVAHQGLNRKSRPLLPARRLSAETIADLIALRGPYYGIYPFTNSSLLMREIKQLDMDVKSMMIAPVVSKDHLIGYIEIGNRKEINSFTKDDAVQMEVLTHFAALALENAYLYEKTEILAQIDDLTGVQNFRFGQRFLERLIQDNIAFKMLFLDLDGFKKINQVHGHLKGNEALQHVSKIIRSSVKPSDLVSRFGGDEFMVVLPGVDLSKAVEIAKRLIHRIEDQSLLSGIQLSGSIGIAEYPEHGQSLQTMIHAADSAMYQAKSKGSGQVTIYNPIG